MSLPKSLAAAALLTACLSPAAASAVHMPLEPAIAVELGGAGLLGSVHYENLLLASGDAGARQQGLAHRLLTHLGLGYVPLYLNGQLTAGNLIVPVGARYLCGLGSHHLELGAAYSSRIKLAGLPVAGTDEVETHSFVPSLGYRYENFADGRILLAASYSPRIAAGVLGARYSHFLRLAFGTRF